jgi:hypothetical protein
MKTAMILTMLVIAGSTIALVPTSSALTCTNYVVHPDPEGLVGCETRYTWIGCNGNEYGLGYVLAHPGVLVNCL